MNDFQAMLAACEKEGAPGWSYSDRQSGELQMAPQGGYRDSVDDGNDDERAAFALRDSELDESERGEAVAAASRGEDGGDGEEVTNEKTFRYYKEMPDSAELRNANKKQPGRGAIAGSVNQ